MTFLVTNDDGIDAPGLASLETLCREYGEVIVAAPDAPQSEMGHRVTTTALVPVTAEAPGRYRIGGTPADCARIGLRCLAPHVDWVVSGINHGGNLGADTYISGTVAAAREAALLGYRSIALSHFVAKGRPLDWSVARRRARRALDDLLQRDLPRGCYWNVNLPHPAHADDCALAFCPLDTNALDVRYRAENGGFQYAGVYQNRPRQPGRDVDVCFRGEIAVTLLPLDLPHTPLVEGQ